MDLVSVAASVAGLLGLTIQVSQMLYEQVHTLKNAPKDAQKLLDELEALRRVLSSLEQFLAAQALKGRSFKETSALINAIQGCTTQISAVKLRLEKFVRKQGLAQMIERGKWYYEQDEHQELIQALHRYLGMFQVSLSVDGIELLSKSADEIAQEIKSVRNAISALTPDAQEAQAKSKQFDDILNLISALPTVSKEISEVTETVQRWDLKWQDKESQEILNWLSPLNFWAKQDDTLARRESGTCQWIFEESAFKEWLGGTQRTLWCPGMPGAGKTVLASAVIDHLQSTFREDDVGLAFIYCNYKEKGEQTLVNLIASLLHQLIQRHTLPSEVHALYKQHINKRTRPTVTEILELLHIGLSSYSRAFLIVDALDECDEGNGTRSRLIDELLRLPTTTYLMVTSRHVPNIETQLNRSCRLEILANDADVRTYLEKQIQREARLRRHVQADPSLKQAILDEVVNAARGMFLLAQLHVDAIAQKHNRKAIRTALPNLPQALDGTYDEAMKRIRGQNKEDTELAQRVLSWLSFALRPLTVVEMKHAISVQPDQTSIDEEDLIDEEILLSVCAGLVVIDQESEVIRLIHYTTQEYFERYRQKEFPDGQTDITRTCLTYVSFEVFQSGYCTTDEKMEERLLRNPLLQYAAQNWGNHARGDVERVLQVQILEFLAQESKLSSMVQVMQIPSYRDKGYSQRSPKIVFSLWVAVILDLVDTASTLLAGDIDLNILTGEETALYTAVWRGHEVMVQLLVNKGANIEATNDFGRTALCGAAMRGHESIVDLLLNKGANIEATNGFGYTALYEAALGGHESTVDLLLNKGANIEATNEFGYTALCRAASGGHKSMVDLLLNKGANIEATNEFGYTALHGAALEGHESIVDLLLNKGANIEATGEFGYTALYEAAWRGYEVMVQLLVNKGAKMETTNDLGETALFGAALGGHESIVDLLLNKGANIDGKNGSGYTALHGAALGGHESIVDLLLNKGANIEAADDSGRTPLSWANLGGKKRVAQLLLNSGAKTEAEDISSHAPM